MILAFDCGGTNLKGALVDPARGIAGELVRVPSPTSEDVLGFCELLAELGQRLAGTEDVAGVAIAMPGPFDYAAGVSWMQHKFPKLFGHELRPALARAFGRERIAFLNDAIAFALGSWRLRHASTARFVAITLGTGLGAGFVVNGAEATVADRAPDNGEIWNLPYEGGILEGRVCRARIRLDQARGVRPDDAALANLETRIVDPGANGLLDELGVPDVAEIAASAAGGAQAAERALSEFGRHLGRGLALGVLGFQPQAVLLGGQIARAGRFFMPALQRELDASGHGAMNDHVTLADLLTLQQGALVGAAQHFHRISQP